MPILVTGLLILLAVLVVAEIAVVYRLRESGSTAETRSSDDAEADEDVEADEAADDAQDVEPLDLSMVARVVTRGDGEEIGESLCVEDGEIIVKGDDGFYAVPQAKVAESGEQLVAEDVDWDQARDEGGSWAEQNNDPMSFGDDGMPSNP